MSENIWFANFFDFQGPLLSESFCCKPIGAISWIVSKTFRIKSNYKLSIQYAKKKKKQEVVQVVNFATFFKFRCLLVSRKAQQASHVFKYWRILWKVTKILKFGYHKAVVRLFLPRKLKMEETQKFHKFHIFSDFKPTQLIRKSL